VEIRGEPIPSAATQSINAISVIMNNFLAGKCTAAAAAQLRQSQKPFWPKTGGKGKNKPFSCTLSALFHILSASCDLITQGMENSSNNSNNKSNCSNGSQRN